MLDFLLVPLSASTMRLTQAHVYLVTHTYIHTLTGSFFTKYPRHRTLISINKRNTGMNGHE